MTSTYATGAPLSQCPISALDARPLLRCILFAIAFLPVLFSPPSCLPFRFFVLSKRGTRAPALASTNPSSGFFLHYEYEKTLPLTFCDPHHLLCCVHYTHSTLIHSFARPPSFIFIFPSTPLSPQCRPGDYNSVDPLPSRLSSSS